MLINAVSLKVVVGVVALTSKSMGSSIAMAFRSNCAVKSMGRPMACMAARCDGDTAVAAELGLHCEGDLPVGRSPNGDK